MKIFKLRKILLKEIEFHITMTSFPRRIFSCYDSLKISCACFKYIYHNLIYLPCMRIGFSNVVTVFSSIIQISSKLAYIFSPIALLMKLLLTQQKFFLYTIVHSDPHYGPISKVSGFSNLTLTEPYARSSMNIT